MSSEDVLELFSLDYSSYHILLKIKLDNPTSFTSSRTNVVFDIVIKL